MKRLLVALALLPLPTFTNNFPANQMQSIDQQAAIMMYLDTQRRAQLKIAQQAAHAFDLNPASVTVCLVYSEGPCRKKHDDHEIVLHLTPDQIAVHPELTRYEIYLSMYMQSLLRNSPLIKSKQRNNFLKGFLRTAAVGGSSFGLFHWLQKHFVSSAHVGNSPSFLISGLGATTIASLWAALRDRDNLSYKLPLEQLTKEELGQLMPKDEAALETILCNKLLRQGHKDTVILHLGYMQADRNRLKMVLDASLPMPQKSQQMQLSQEQSFQLRLFHLTTERIKAVIELLQGHGIRNIDEEIVRVEQHNYETMVRPMLEQLLATAGPLEIVREYRNLVHVKAQRGDLFTPYGTRCSTAIDKMKEFCAQHNLVLANLLKEITVAESKEIAALIEKSYTMENGQRLLKKLLAQFLISCELGVDSEIDGNEHLKKITKMIETALTKYPKN